MIIRLYRARPGSSLNISRSRAATGLTMRLATLRKPEWQRLPVSSRKCAGDAGDVDRLTAQSINEAVPRMAKIMVCMWSIGMDFIVIAFVAVKREGERWCSASLGTEGLV